MKKRFCSEHFWEICLLLLLIMCAIPLLWIARYNYSSADDFSYGCLSRWAWVDTHSLINVFKAVGAKVKNTYLTWQGSYSAIILFALTPSAFSEKYYVFTTVMMLGTLVFSTFYSCRKLIETVGGNKHVGNVVALVLLILNVELLPAPVEAFYWWNGSVYYVVYYSLLLIQTAMLVQVMASDKCSVAKLIGLCFLGAWISGGNYITALLSMEIGFFVLLGSAFQKKKVIWKEIIVYMISVIGFLINCLAPGNAFRQSAFEAWSPIRAVLYSFHDAYKYMIEWSQPLVVLGIVFLIPFLWKIPQLLQPIRKSVWGYLLMLAVQYGMFASTFTPTRYAYGAAGAGRIQNIRFFFWILSCVIMEYIVICMVKLVTNEAARIVLGEEGPDKFMEMVHIVYDRYAIVFFGGILVAGLFFGGNTLLADDTRDLVSVTAVKSIISGEAKTYGTEMKQRQLLYESDKAVAEVEPLSVKPELLVWEDITDNPDEWVNSVVAKFYRKEKVYLKRNQ